MAPSFDNFDGDEIEVDEDEIDFSDLHEQYEVKLEEGLDTFIVVDGLPKVNEEQKSRLVKFLLRKLTSVGKVRGDVWMPMNDDESESLGYAFVEYESAEQAIAATKALHGTALDRRHTIAVNKLTDIDRFGREGRIDDEYHEPEVEPFEPKDHLRWWMGDEDGRDQFVMFRGENVGIFWNEREESPDNIIDRRNWTELFVQWSPLGTYLTSLHSQGVQLWGGPGWKRQGRFAHVGVNLVDFSPNEKYLITWSHKPIEVDENDPILSAEDDGKNYIVWEIATGLPLRSFVTLDIGPTVDAEGNRIKQKIPWPAFKWSSDEKYVARMTQGQSISVYELPRMNLLDKTSIKIEGVMDFEWSPTLPQRDSVKQYEQLLCYWTPELGSNPAKVGLMSIPTKEIVRTRNLFNVSDARLHWQSESAYLCVKVDRHSKSKKSMATNLEIFRIKERGVPVEVVDSIKDTVINFAWEPKGDRFVLITTGEIPVAGVAVPPKTSVSFFCPEKQKGNIPGNFKHIRTIDKKTSNAIYWCPKGRIVVVATVHSQQNFDLDFWDLDFEGERDEKDKDLTANLQLMATADHYGVTDIEWDPSGRFVATSASMWKHSMENGYHLYDFKGELLREEHIDRFKQFLWRPRPPTMLTKEDQKNVRKNLREYSKQFDQQDFERKNTATRAVIESRRQMFQEFMAWRERTVEEDQEERQYMGDTSALKKQDDDTFDVVEEIIEEIVNESEQVEG